MSQVNPILYGHLTLPPIKWSVKSEEYTHNQTTMAYYLLKEENVNLVLEQLSITLSSLK